MKIRQNWGLGMVSRWVCTGISIFRQRERFRQKHNKKSLDRGCKRGSFTPHSPPTHGPSHSKPGGATTRTALGEGGQHRAEGWHARREAEQPGQQEHYQRGLAHVLVLWRVASPFPAPALAPAGLRAVSCSLPLLRLPSLLLLLRKSP
jgi:hypothetical protein